MRWLLLLPLSALAAACGSPEAAERPSPAAVNRLGLLGAVTQTSAGGRVAVPSSLSPAFPARAVDHVVTYAARQSWRTGDADRATLPRHGALVRLEFRSAARRGGHPAEPSDTFANLDTGASISLERNAEGALASVWLSQGESEEERPAIYRYRLVDGGGLEEIAGERCRVWRAEPVTDGSPSHSACISADGVVLRETVHFSSDGRVMRERRALSVERRPVAAAEVLPPRAALDWAQWTESSPRPSGQNYSVTLASRAPDPEERRRTFLADGLYRAEEQRAGDRLTSLEVAGAGALLSYDGRRPQLRISRGLPPSGRGVALPLATAPVPGREALQVLGERCRWLDAAPGMADYGRIECRTGDGLPLVIEESRRGSRTEWEAVSLSRGRTPTGGARPPEELLRWSRWGWPMLDRRQERP